MCREWGDCTFKGVVHKARFVSVQTCLAPLVFNKKFSLPLYHIYMCTLVILYLSLLTHVHTHSEVRQSLSNAQTQYSQWSMLLDSEADIDKIQSVGSELKNCIKSIEWDLEDLDQTISILTNTKLPLLR